MYCYVFNTMFSNYEPFLQNSQACQPFHLSNFAPEGNF